MHYVTRAGVHFWFGRCPASLRADWSIVAARAPLLGAATWTAGAWHFAAGRVGEWLDDWSGGDVAGVVCVTRDDVRTLLEQRLAVAGRTLDVALAATPGGMAALCAAHDLPWTDPSPVAP